jgi:hypothetical protein
LTGEEYSHEAHRDKLDIKIEGFGEGKTINGSSTLSLSITGHLRARKKTRKCLFFLKLCFSICLTNGKIRENRKRYRIFFTRLDKKLRLIRHISEALSS